MQFTSHDIFMLFLAVAALIGFARIMAIIAQWCRQPAVIGEIFAGIVLGPTIFGAIAPKMQASIFPVEGPVGATIEGLSTIAIALFLLVAGMEIDLSTVWRQGKSAFVVGLFGIIVPFTLGFVPAFVVPEWLGATEGSDRLIFALFLATAMSITALPVIAKILLDLRLYQTDLGITIVAAAIFNDLVGWIIFAFVLAMMGSAHSGFTPTTTAILTLIFTALMLTLGRWSINRILPWIQAHTEWPGGVLGFALTCTMLAAAFTEWIGVHAIFGAFLFGVALGDSWHLRQRTRATIDQFVSFVFAPIFFASIGLRANFIESFDLVLVVVVLVIATVGKIGGCWIAARWIGFGRDESRAIGYGMNARGAMEIVLGLLALEAGIIGDELFVALVIMALLTSMTSGALIQKTFGKARTATIFDFIGPKSLITDLNVSSREDAIRTLAMLAAEAAGIEPDSAVRRVLIRERIISSAMTNGIAIPHARLRGIERPYIAVGLSPQGIDFDAADGQLVHVIIVILTPASDVTTHLTLLAEIAGIFRDASTAPQIAERVTSLTELRAAFRVESAQQQEDKAAAEVANPPTGTELRPSFAPPPPHEDQPPVNLTAPSTKK